MWRNHRIQNTALAHSAVYLGCTCARVRARRAATIARLLYSLTLFWYIHQICLPSLCTYTAHPHPHTHTRSQPHQSVYTVCTIEKYKGQSKIYWIRFGSTIIFFFSMCSRVHFTWAMRLYGNRERNSANNWIRKKKKNKSQATTTTVGSNYA